jgi:hypothetical protein
MRNRQVGPDTDALADLVSRLTYKPGWTFELKEISRGQGSEGLTLLIGAEVPDSFGNGRTNVLHLMPVMPAAYDEETWQRWILDQILLVEQHEALEFFQIDGEKRYFPEHGPGRNPYTVADLKTPDQAHTAAVPWTNGPPQDEHFQPAP